MMRNQGLTIMELLAAVIIMAIAFSLVAMLITTFQQANRRIEVEARANTEASLLIAHIEREIDGFGPTDVRACDTGNCVILEKHFETTYRPDQGSIVVETYDPPLDYTVRLAAGGLSLGGTVYAPEHLQLSSAEIAYTEDAEGHVDLSIAFTLSTDDGSHSFDYHTTYAFTVESAPPA